MLNSPVMLSGSSISLVRVGNEMGPGSSQNLFVLGSARLSWQQKLGGNDPVLILESVPPHSHVSLFQWDTLIKVGSL